MNYRQAAVPTYLSFVHESEIFRPLLTLPSDKYFLPIHYSIYIKTFFVKKQCATPARIQYLIRIAVFFIASCGYNETSLVSLFL